jgi:hypothetical protein
MNPIKSLLRANLELLDSACSLLNTIDDAVYREPAPDGSGHRVGAQFRHVIDFYDCLLAGIEAGRVDYDARKRVALLETSRSAAVSRVREIADALRHRSLWSERDLQVRMEDAPDECRDAWMMSSVARELQAVRSHTIHHFALIAMALQAWSVKVDATFGLAPSTLRFNAPRAA